MFKINVKKLVSSLWYDFDSLAIWTDEAINVTNLNKDFENLTPLSEPFGHLRDKIEYKWGKEEHLRRILYFVENPLKIEGINIDNEVHSGHILPVPKIIDGNHRLIAAMYLKMEYVQCGYGGRQDVLDYLTDKTDSIPFE